MQHSQIFTQLSHTSNAYQTHFFTTRHFTLTSQPFAVLDSLFKHADKIKSNKSYTIKETLWYIMHCLDSIFYFVQYVQSCSKCSNITEIHGIRVLVFADAPILHHLENLVHMQW
jgi:hypothetical protein